MKRDHCGGPPGLRTGSWGEGCNQERGCEVRAEPRVAEGRAWKGDPRRGRSAGTGIRCRRGEAGGPSRISPGGGGGGRKQPQALGLPAGQNLRLPQVKPSQMRFFSDEVQRAGSQGMRKASPGASAVLRALLPRFPVASRAGAGEAHRGQATPRAPPRTRREGRGGPSGPRRGPVGPGPGQRTLANADARLLGRPATCTRTRGSRSTSGSGGLTGRTRGTQPGRPRERGCTRA